MRSHTTGINPATAAVSLAVRLSLVVLLSSLSAPSARPIPTDEIESQTLPSSMSISHEEGSILMSQEFPTCVKTKGRLIQTLQQMHPCIVPKASYRIGSLKLLHEVPSGPNPISQAFPNHVNVIEGTKRSPPPPSP